MRLELIRDEETTAAGGITGRLFVDGSFFGYTLENAATAFPEGSYKLYTRFSPKFLKNKIAIEVPDRNYIMFHGANVPEDLAGCVGVAANRKEDGTIYGNTSDALYALVAEEADAGRAILDVRKKNNLIKVVAILAVAALIFIR